MTRKRPDPIATLAAEALGYLGGKEGFAALSSIVLDADANAVHAKLPRKRSRITTLKRGYPTHHSSTP